MEALTEYAYRARLRDITEMSVSVEASASPDSNELVKISSENLATVYKFDVIFITFSNNLSFIYSKISFAHRLNFVLFF